MSTITRNTQPTIESIIHRSGFEDVEPHALGTILTRRKFIAAAAAALALAGCAKGRGTGPIISCWGDSLTEGWGAPRGLDYPSVLGGLFRGERVVSNHGRSGETSGQITSRFNAAELLNGDTSVFWMGHNNVGQPDQILNDIESCLGRLLPTPSGEKRALILTLLNGNFEDHREGAPGHRQILNLNEQIMTRWPANSFDIRAAVVRASSGVNDVVSADWRSDDIHLNEHGSAFVAAQVKAYLDGKGW